MAATAVAVPVIEPEERTFEVVAPSALNGGYEFFVDAGNNTSYKVRVPEGGVKAGQRFQAIIVSDAASRGSHNIPFGRWRDGLCDCCAFGCCHPAFCLTFWICCWCQLCSLGQVLTRMKLFWSAGVPPAGETPKPSACAILSIVALVYAVTIQVLNVIYYVGLDSYTIATNSTNTTGLYGTSNSYGTTDSYGKTDSYGAIDSGERVVYTSSNDFARYIMNVLFILMVILTVSITTRFRSYLRKKYNIPEQSCNGCEDCCCAFWCQPCTICQMHRHTADFRNYPAGCCECCNGAGLPQGAPEVV